MSNKLRRLSDNNFTTMPLSQAKTGKTYKITDCAVKPPADIRLAEMGVVRNTVLTVVKTAPLGDPVIFKLRGYLLCLRSDAARDITVTEADLYADVTAAKEANNDRQ